MTTTYTSSGMLMFLDHKNEIAQFHHPSLNGSIMCPSVQSQIENNVDDDHNDDTEKTMSVNDDGFKRKNL